MVLIVQTAVYFVFAILNVSECPFPIDDRKTKRDLQKSERFEQTISFQNKSSSKTILSEHFDMQASV